MQPLTERKHNTNDDRCACVYVCVTAGDIYMWEKQVKANQYLPTMDVIWAEGCDVRWLGWTDRLLENAPVCSHGCHRTKIFENRCGFIGAGKIFYF